MNVIVLMAGLGKRFKDQGYELPKPMIKVRYAKSILQWTTCSIFPHIFDQASSYIFSILKEQDKNKRVSSFLKRAYGESIKIKVFNKLTQGNLETAYLTAASVLPEEEDNVPLLFLDSDNYYNGENFNKQLKKIKDKNFAMICYFKPKDKSEKWCFAKIDIATKKVLAISEKKRFPGNKGKPMMGVFYFSSKSLFVNAAKDVLKDSNQKLNNEFYMSKSIERLLEKKIPVYAFEATEVWPLGTPEDLKIFEEKFK